MKQDNPLPRSLLHFFLCSRIFLVYLRQHTVDELQRLRRISFHNVVYLLDLLLHVFGGCGFLAEFLVKRRPDSLPRDFLQRALHRLRNLVSGFLDLRLSGHQSGSELCPGFLTELEILLKREPLFERLANLRNSCRGVLLCFLEIPGKDILED